MWKSMGSLYQNVKLVFCHAVALYDKKTDFFFIKSAGQYSKTDIFCLKSTTSKIWCFIIILEHFIIWKWTAGIFGILCSVDEKCHGLTTSALHICDICSDIHHMAM